MSIHWLKLHYMDIKNNNNLAELEQMKEKEVTGFFWLGLQIAFIFGIPAFLAAFIGKKIATHFDNKNIVTIALVISFVISWFLVAYFYKKKAKKLKIIEDKIKSLKQKDILK